jgi:hypothetical protein
MEIYDPYLDKKGPPLKDPAVFFIGTNHDRFKEYKFPKGSVVIDPWRILEPQEDVQLISIGSPAQRKVAVSNLRKFHAASPGSVAGGNTARQNRA